MFLPVPKLYPITDVRLSGLSHAEQVVRLGAGGATLAQLREKNLSPREFFKQAEEAMRAARQHGVRIIINDRADIALALKADGVHLGQDDLPPDAARRLLGSKAIIGFSTHSVEQAIRAARLPLDYVAIGPIFATSTKKNPDPAVGLSGLLQVRKAVAEMPLVAIGGITRENAADILAAGADSVALIGAVISEPEEIAKRTKQLLDSL
jgi:thiamine-phosphate pyrophosphorylase